MTVREDLVVELAKQVLGPRGGPREVLSATEDPRDEYLVGVLAPKQAPPPKPGSEEERNPDADAELIPNGEAKLVGELGDEDDQDDPAVAVEAPTAISPALDPKSLPSSLGVSAVFSEDGGKPVISVCATWGRYEQTAQGGWQRTPHHSIKRDLPASKDDTWSAGNGVQIVLRSRPLANGRFRVSVYLVNVTKVSGDRPRTQDLVFQPEIRIVAEKATHVEPLERSPSKGDVEEESLELMYRERRAFARGHLTSAVWADIDPQRPFATRPAIGEPPFAWVDGSTVPPKDRKNFELPAVRTDYLPLYNIVAPAIDWDVKKFGPPPVLDASQLAEAFVPADLERSLRPLVAGYMRWIDQQKAAVSTLPPNLQPAARRHIQLVEESRDRISQGIDLLLQDDQARLAFCFMNKAMQVQAAWSRNQQTLEWRPFQIAFILQCIRGVADDGSPERDIFDLLWFPTGGGKTEAYLGLAIFALALRRRRAQAAKEAHAGGGVGVLSRYTLRLLTIQQFRRALTAITAAEYIRVDGLQRGGPIGWRPKAYSGKETYPWGLGRFSVGLWVGSGVTPNLLDSYQVQNEDGKIIHVVGALEILASVQYPWGASGEPAQILSCPACKDYLAIPGTGLEPATTATVHLVVRLPKKVGQANLAKLSNNQMVANSVTPTPLPSGFTILSFNFTTTDELTPQEFDEFILARLGPALGCKIDRNDFACARPSRSGYFIKTFQNQRGNDIDYDFEVVCANPRCPLSQVEWFEMVPVPAAAAKGQPAARPKMQFQEVLPAFALHHDRMRGMPIPAYCVDDQIYHRCPSMVIATVDKFARLSFEPKAANIFGNVTHYHARWGYYRIRAPPASPPAAKLREHPPVAGLTAAITSFPPPDLVIQDELHLIEGPLGSIVGLYETALDVLASRKKNGSAVRAKYVASTATIRQAENQVQSLYDRRLAQFPASGLTTDDSFFARTSETHSRDDTRPGRLYVGLAAPGRGAQTPIVRAWSTLLQRVYELAQAGAPPGAIDPFWTLVGYFNAIRELAGAAGLCRQDIPQRMGDMANNRGSPLRPFEAPLQLSSWTESHKLPSILVKLGNALPGPALDAVLATSMFGTGVDIERLSLMMVHGQPKTTSSYIQSTGRVGRTTGGLVLTFLRASRPRDLDHYEFFAGYHRALHRAVEPITVAPFSPRARDRALGPLAVAILRNAREVNGIGVHPGWYPEQKGQNRVIFSDAIRMAQNRGAPELKEIVKVLEARAQAQPKGRKPQAGDTATEASSEFDRWESLAARAPSPDSLVYFESGMLRAPIRNVVLGDLLHETHNLEVAFERAPQSLRDVESTIRFEG